jgi:hypothetical protein
LRPAARFFAAVGLRRLAVPLRITFFAGARFAFEVALRAAGFFALAMVASR